MRKMFWCCATLAVAAAGVAYAGADYMSSHPFSLLSRCVVLAYNIGASSGEIARVAGTVIVRACHEAEQNPAEPCKEPSMSCVPPDPVPVAGPKELPSAPAPVDEPLDMSQGRLPGKIVIHDNEEQEAPAGPQEFVVRPVFDERLPEFPAQAPQGVIDDDHRIMPYCTDDHPPDCCEEQPTKTQSSSWTEFWMMFFPKPAVEKDMSGGGEESESSGSGIVPKCQEDPSVDTQYPGCPHHDCHERMVCPYTGKSYPVDEVVEPPQPPKQKKKKQKPVDPDHISKKIQSSPWWWGPFSSELDTMEFRKSDWKADDVQLPPF
jgi:hypothetical protein